MKINLDILYFFNISSMAKIIFKLYNGSTIEFELDMAKGMFSTIRDLMEDTDTSQDTEMPLVIANPFDEEEQLANPDVMNLIKQYCEFHHKMNTKEFVYWNEKEEQNPFVENEDTERWDTEFFKNISQTKDDNHTKLFPLIHVSNYLGCDALSNRACLVVSGQFENKSPEEIREYYDLPDDLTEEEKQQISKENEWLEFDK